MDGIDHNLCLLDGVVEGRKVYGRRGGCAF